MPSLKPRRVEFWRVAVLLGAAIIPLLALAPIILLEARHQAKGEALVAADLVRRQIDNILLRAQDAVDGIASDSTKDCASEASLIQQKGTLLPYFRSLSLVRDNRVYCSSVLGAVNLSVDELLSLDALPQGRLIMAVPGTALVPDRPAILVGMGLEAGRGAIAVVDGQYIFDLQSAAGYNGRYLIDVLLGNNLKPLLEAGERARMPLPLVEDQTDVSASRMFPLEVNVTVDKERLVMYSVDLFRSYLPFLVLASLLCMYFANRLYTRRISLAVEIRKGMRNREFHLVYQPVVNLATGQFDGVEALLRWTHPRYGNMRPDLFIPVAEENGLIADLTRHVFALAASDAKLLNLSVHMHLGVNVCGEHMAQPCFVDDVNNLRAKLGSAGPTIVLEVTERDTLPDTPLVMENMAKLRAQGIRWAIDDFGTGQSSLAYIERLNADFLKIDRAFVNGIGSDGVNAVVLETIIGLSSRLGLEMIAEGIETRAQATFLRERGVQWAQGYYFARPMPAAEISAWRVKAQGLGSHAVERGVPFGTGPIAG